MSILIVSRRAMLASGLALAALVAGCGRADPESAVTLDIARAELAAGRATLVDVREPAEHAAGVVAGARLIPLQQLGARMREIPARPDEPVLLICHTQNRPSAALRALRERGYSNVRYVQGGMSEWMRRGWPLVKP
jgi:hypothetical protein